MDKTGNPVAGISVQLVATDGSLAVTTTTSAEGRYSVEAPAGHDQLIVPASQGFAAAAKPVTVHPGMSDVNLALVPDAVIQTVSVGAEPALSTDGASNQDTVSLSSDSLNELPVFDQDLVGAITPFLDPAATSTSGVSLVVDGVEVKNVPVTPSAIADMRINTDPYSAEFSSPGRGRIEITTKPGSPEFHGALNFLLRNSALNARNFFAPAKPSKNRRIMEGNVTGPVARGGRTTFLLSGALRNDDIQAYVHAYGTNGVIEQNVSTPSTHDQILGRVTHDFSDAHRLSVAYDFFNRVVQGSGVGGLVLAEAGYTASERVDEAHFTDRVIISPRLIQQAMIVLERDDVTNASDTAAPSIQVQDAFTGGGAQADMHRSENTVHITDVVSWTNKKHYVRFGLNIPQLSRRSVDDYTNRLGRFNFSSIGSYQNDTPYQYTVQSGVGRGLYWINEIGAFAQDQVTVRPSLQVTVGVRYQWQTYISDIDCFSPRLSFAYAANKSWVIRGGTGIFYDRTGGDYPITFKLHNGTVLRQYQILNPGYPNPLPPGASLSALPTGLVLEAANLRAPYQVQYSLTTEHRLGGLIVTAGYRGISGIGSFRSRDTNAPFSPTYTAVADTNLGFVQQIESPARSQSNALDLELHCKWRDWFAGEAQYTFSHNNSNTGGINWFPQDQYAPNAEWGRTDYDRRHRFNLLATLHQDHWLSLGMAVTLYSGAPYTELAGADIYKTGLGNARPPGVDRPTLQGSGVSDLDLTWAHDFHLVHSAKDPRAVHLGISAFNVLNHAKFGGFVGTVKSPLYQQPTAAQAARQIQFDVGYQF